MALKSLARFETIDSKGRELHVRDEVLANAGTVDPAAPGLPSRGSDTLVIPDEVRDFHGTAAPVGHPYFGSGTPEPVVPVKAGPADQVLAGAGVVKGVMAVFDTVMDEFQRRNAEASYEGTTDFKKNEWDFFMPDEADRRTGYRYGDHEVYSSTTSDGVLLYYVKDWNGADRHLINLEMLKYAANATPGAPRFLIRRDFYYDIDPRMGLGPVRIPQVTYSPVSED